MVPEEDSNISIKILRNMHLLIDLSKRTNIKTNKILLTNLSLFILFGSVARIASVQSGRRAKSTFSTRD